MSLIGLLISNPSQVFSGTAIGFISVLFYYIMKFYSNRKNFPPGPTPLPLFGNLFMMRGVAKHVHQFYQEIGTKYNGIYTFYLGYMPQVIVTNPSLALEVMKKHQFAGRPYLPLADKMFLPNSADVIFSDFNKEWELLRKVVHSAVRKYASGNRLPVVVAEVVDNVFSDLRKKGINGEIDIDNFMENTMYWILSRSAFGENIDINDKGIRDWIDSMKFRFQENTRIILTEFVPLLKYVMPSVRGRFYCSIKQQHAYISRHYKEHLDSFDPEKIRDFTDALLSARQEAEQEDNESAIKYLKPANIQNAMQDLFLAGTETSRVTLLWSFLLMTSYPEVQEKIRHEIHQHISDEIPDLSHRNKCNYTAAFIAEVLRYRHMAAIGVPHKATVDTQLGEHLIKKGTMIIAVISAGLSDKETWGDPEVFRPKRFLDLDGKFVPRPNPFYVPFSAGRRTCPGEKLALADIFFVIARFMQQIKGFQMCLPQGADLEKLMYGDPYKSGNWMPFPFKVILKEIKDSKLSFKTETDSEIDEEMGVPHV